MVAPMPHLSQLIMELEQIAREVEGKVQTKQEAADNLVAVAEQLYRLAGRMRREP
jgi:hypothetical protein